MTGTNFTWTALEPAGISGVITSGTSTIPVQTLTNSTNLPIVVTYLAKAESNSGASCQSFISLYDNSQSSAINHNGTKQNYLFQYCLFNNSLKRIGKTSSWNYLFLGFPVITGGITGAASTNQTTINGTLVNPTNDVQTATYTIIPKSGMLYWLFIYGSGHGKPFPKSCFFSGSNQTYVQEVT
jgi:hypothetical protein